MLVRDVMSTPVVTVGPSTPPREAARLLATHGFTALPVVDPDGELLGIVTEADLLRDRIHHDPRSPLLREELAAPPSATTVAEVMSRDVRTAVPWTDLADLVATMSASGIRSMPVLDESRRVVGIVSRRDVVRTCARPDEAIATDVRHRLSFLGRPDRWRVSVQDGTVDLGDPVGDPAESHAASVVASAVPGVLAVRTHPEPE